MHTSPQAISITFLLFLLPFSFGLSLLLPFSFGLERMPAHQLWEGRLDVRSQEVKENLAQLLAIGHEFRLFGDVGPPLAYWLAEIAFRIAGMFGVYVLASNLGMPMGFPMPWVITVVILLTVISILSGLFSLGVLKKSQPADLLR